MIGQQSDPHVQHHIESEDEAPARFNDYLIKVDEGVQLEDIMS